MWEWDIGVIALHRHRKLIATGLLSFFRLRLNCKSIWRVWRLALTYSHQVTVSKVVVGQRHIYSIAQTRIKGNGISLNASLQPEPLSFRVLKVNMISENKSGSLSFSSPSWEDWAPEQHKTLDMTAEVTLLVQESPLLSSTGEKNTI